MIKKKGLKQKLIQLNEKKILDRVKKKIGKTVKITNSYWESTPKEPIVGKVVKREYENIHLKLKNFLTFH